MPRLRPGFLDHPAPPVARVSGHLSGCFDSCGNYRSCVPGCTAWNDAAAREQAHVEYERDAEKWLTDLKADYAERAATTEQAGEDPKVK